MNNFISKLLYSLKSENAKRREMEKAFASVDEPPEPSVKMRFARTKAVGLWLRDHVLAGVIISVVSLIVGIYIGRWLPPSQPQNQSHIPAPTSSRPVS